VKDIILAYDNLQIRLAFAQINLKYYEFYKSHLPANSLLNYQV